MLAVVLLAFMVQASLSSLVLPPAAPGNCTAATDCLTVPCPTGQGHSWIVALLWFDAFQPAFQAFFRNVWTAISVLQSFGPLISTDRVKPHVTTQYFCCKTPAELATIVQVMNATPWKPLNVSFDQLVCNDDQHNGQNTTSIVARLDPASQALMGAAVTAWENAIIAAGVPIRHRRAGQEYFHSTVAVVDRAFPTAAALQAVNAKITHWTGAVGPIVVSRLLMLDPITMFSSH